LQHALGERLHFSLLVMSECGSPIYPLESKSVLRYHQRSKVGKIAQMDASLFDEAMTVISASTALSLLAFSKALVTVVQFSP
jgi:tetrahydromethanopterin S-methyltransferase subunit C